MEIGHQKEDNHLHGHAGYGHDHDSQSVDPVQFLSSNHVSYRHGEPMGEPKHTQCIITVQPDARGRLMAKIMEEGRLIMAPKPMTVLHHDAEELELKGMNDPVTQQDFSEYELHIIYEDGDISQITWHLLERGTDIVYLK